MVMRSHDRETPMSRTEDRSSTPRAVIHKRILDIAGSKPDASMAEIADEIGGASTELVERVLEEYGDPAGDEQGSGETDERSDESGIGGQEGSNMDGEKTRDRSEIVERNGRTIEEREGPDDMAETGSTRNGTGLDEETGAESGERTGRAEPDDGGGAELSGKQRRALRLVAEDPEATQGAIAEQLDVTRATVSRWLSDVPGFEWAKRQEFVERRLDGGEVHATDGPVDQERLEELARRIDAIERKFEGLETEKKTEAVAIDPELAHKVVHACMNCDRITEEEELRLLKELMG